MISNLSPTAARQRAAGWLGIALMFLVYGALFGANFWLPLDRGSYTMRIWRWSQLALTATAVLVLLPRVGRLTTGRVMLGLALALLAMLSYAARQPRLPSLLQEGAAVWLCFLAANVLFHDLAQPRVPAFQPPATAVGRSLLTGAAVAVPLAAVNNLYFFLTASAVQFENPLASAAAALQPGISEEIVYRYFVLALGLVLLRFEPSRRLALATALFLAVVPHSLNHLPDLFRDNARLGVVMLAATSLLFGLPMAWLQVRRNLETAVSFHWFIDFARFLFGY